MAIKYDIRAIKYDIKNPLRPLRDKETVFFSFPVVTGSEKNTVGGTVCPPQNPLPKVLERRANLSASLQEPPSYSPNTSQKFNKGIIIRFSLSIFRRERLNIVPKRVIVHIDGQPSRDTINPRWKENIDAKIQKEEAAETNQEKNGQEANSPTTSKEKGHNLLQETYMACFVCSVFGNAKDCGELRQSKEHGKGYSRIMTMVVSRIAEGNHRRWLVLDTLRHH